ncbi:MAG: helix-turn-helix transcriptional regulator [Peptoniphilaceae bacterium]|nr:helix-turn-helix transcriptional regulator [Peptoniphilaceae bacterium]
MLHENFDEWKRLNKLSDKDLAEAAGITPSSISYYRTNHMPFPIPFILAWKKAYRLTDEQVFRLAFEYDFRPDGSAIKTAEDIEKINLVDRLREVLR